MYKKIKNSSFMNLIWFLLATLPFVLLLIYAIGFFNNEDLRANEQDNYTLTLNSINGNTLKTIENQQQNYISNNTLATINENGYYTSNSTGIHTIKIQLYTIGQDDTIIWNDSILTNNNYYYLGFLNKDNLSYEFNIYLSISYTQNGGTINTSYNYNTNDAFTNKNYFELDLSTWYQESKTYLQNTYTNLHISNLSITYYKTGANSEQYIEYYPILTTEKIFINNNWFNNYKQYVNDFNSIKFNSCPISYTYNDNTYNIETNSNNYLGTNETIEINQNFNYTLNEQPTLNYNNYFITQPIYETITTTEIVNNLPDYINLHETPNILDGIIAHIPEGNPQPNIKYYVVLSNFEYGEFTWQTDEQPTPENFEEYREDIRYFTREITQENITGYEYYNIESTINTSLELIPNNNFNDFLTNVNNTIKTNGFISNAFLNLATLFGVNNVYYSLACYYIEYLLVIILLHLAFDVLYIVPNICHKFMEKIGGERD